MNDFFFTSTAVVSAIVGLLVIINNHNIEGVLWLIYSSTMILASILIDIKKQLKNKL